MASNQLDYSSKIDFSVFGNELVTLSPYAADVYGSLCNNRLHVFQPNCQMDLSVIKAVLVCYFKTVHSVYIQSPQVAFIDICIGKEFTSEGFRDFFYNGIHRATFPENPVLDCNVVFTPLSAAIEVNQMYTLARAIPDYKQLPGMNLQYLHRNVEWNPDARPKLLDLPSSDDPDLYEQEL